MDLVVENSKKWPKNSLIFLILGIFGIVGGAICVLIGILTPKPGQPKLNFPEVGTTENDNKIYSNLTGLELADASLVTAPTYCIQTPNGTDGARPQAGLDQAGVIFEAIAEAGITRFAAIYQNPTAAVIGPIRSLRLYYLQWDTPFDCTIVHAGGADDALAAVRNGGYKDLTENYTYMYRSKTGNRLWNNLFTNATKLAEFTTDKGYTTSSIKGFARFTPENAEKNRIDNTVAEKLVITEPAKGDTSALAPITTEISLRFGNVPTYNVEYSYDVATNSYRRSYGNGNPHNIYSCPSEALGNASPENSCTLTQMSPKVVIAMIVNERKASDNYHEDITTLGTGTAYVFQNGIAIKGTWTKNTVADQIIFKDESSNEISLVPGQTFISAIPTYGSVDY